MYRIGFLLDSLIIQAWQAETIRKLLSTGKVEISVFVVNDSPRPSGGNSPVLYRIYRKLDRILFKNSLDAFKQVPLSQIIPETVPILSVNPIQKKYRDNFSEDDLKRIDTFNSDILIRFGFRILSGEILNLPKLGVWSFHHGDPSIYRGGPPAFWEVMCQIPATGCVLMRINEQLDQGEMLYQTHTQTDPLSVQRNANRIFWMSASFPARVIQSLNSLGSNNWKRKDISSTSNFSSSIRKPPKTRSMLGLGLNLFSRNLKRKLLERIKTPHWEIGWTSNLSFKNQVLLTTEVQLIQPKKGSRSFLADPFPILEEDKVWVFAEQFDKRKKKGHIVVVDEEGNFTPVIEEDYHLSYPFIWKEDGGYWMIPESADSGKLFLYQARDFPFSWKKYGLIFEEEAYDPTLWKTEEGYWLFVNQKSHPGCSPFDELYLYYTESIFTPKWISHPKNPIVSDVRCSRPAGSLFQKDGKLFRPAQDSEKRYGHRIRVMEVKQLTLSSYHEEESYRIEPDENQGNLGLHTMNALGDRWIVDFYTRK
ncbi:hypothetical protein AO498_13595 [Algoriphagus sanaruensis]|uniref:Glucosamine inositolphosphorylceramide transferase 1 N-terminal domain-containing protein n=1 Tax=Algoriphagus sanaruensis TaxID=1727163 RepID=A0A142EQS2_9BACT|nr:hypothetical protein AO498_13595 [Algoriphagus sanaruensis]